MQELLAWNSVWSRDLVELMLPVALKIQAQGARRQFGAVAAAVAGLFSREGSKGFLEWLDGIDKKVEEMELRARGHEPPPQDDSDQLAKDFGSEG